MPNLNWPSLFNQSLIKFPNSRKNMILKNIHFNLSDITLNSSIVPLQFCLYFLTFYLCLTLSPNDSSDHKWDDTLSFIHSFIYFALSTNGSLYCFPVDSFLQVGYHLQKLSTFLKAFVIIKFKSILSWKSLEICLPSIPEKWSLRGSPKMAEE